MKFRTYSNGQTIILHTKQFAVQGLRRFMYPFSSLRTGMSDLWWGMWLCVIISAWKGSCFSRGLT